MKNRSWKKTWTFAPGMTVPVSAAVILFYTAMFLAPFLFSIFLAFNNWDFVGQRIWIGLDGFKRMFADRRFWGGLAVVAKFAVVFLPLALASQLLLAVIYDLLRPRVQKPFLALFFIPAITPWVAAVVIWKWVLWPTGGLFNAALRALSLPPQPLLSSGSQALYCIILILIWRYIGQGAVIFLAGINEIPDVMYESAELDGASFWRKLFGITIPLLRPVLTFRLIAGVISILQMFEPFYLLTGGGPGHSTRVLAYYAYEHAFQRLNFGYASNLLLALFVILVVLTAIQLRVMRTSWEY